MEKGYIESHEIKWVSRVGGECSYLGGKRSKHLGIVVDYRRFMALRCGKCRVVTFIYPKE